jgi:hypothetical protein
MLPLQALSIPIRRLGTFLRSELFLSFSLREPRNQFHGPDYWGLPQESGAWLNAPPVSSLGLRLDDDSITISVGLRLGVPICRPHMCRQCGTHVDKYGLHGLSCRKSQGRHPCHNAINGIIHRSLTAARVPCQVEPQGLSRNDGKRPDGVTLLLWRNGRPLIWDATCSDTFAPTYSSMASVRAGAVADAAETRKAAQYRHLLATHIFAPVAIETSGNFGSDTHLFQRRYLSVSKVAWVRLSHTNSYFSGFL